MPEARTSKSEKRGAAREQSRMAREKQLRQERVRRWLIPSGVTVIVLAVVAVVVIVIVVSMSAPAPQTAAGPKNVISDGILFTGVDGKAVATSTPAIPAKGSPTAHPSDAGGNVPHIVEYIDFACPYCDQFESTNSATIQTLVAAGKVTLEVRPVAILDGSFLGSRYPSRAINAIACVANFSPNDFLTVMAAFYARQPKEGTTGLTNGQIVRLVRNAGVSSNDVATCITGESYRSWVATATGRFVADPANMNSAGQIGTPTILVNGKLYSDSVTDSASFDNFLAAARS
jgi:protein-disulfide isomerase